MEFSEIFNKYIKATNCTSRDLSNESGLSESIISRYKNGTRIPNNETIIKLSKAIATLSDNKYSESGILNDFYSAANISNINFNVVVNNLNILINMFNINASALSKFLNYDASYLSRIRNNTRIPSNKEEFIDSLTNFILKEYNNEQYNNMLKDLIGNEISFDNIKNWLLTNKVNETDEVSNFLNKLDEFDLNDFIKSIKFDELKIPSIPFFKAKTKSYYGIEEMKKGELDFFKATVLSKSKEDIFMCSDMPMEDMAEDTEFGKKWMFGIALSLKKGLHLNIIHNLDRPFNEMMLGLESWIPIYMTGQVSPYFFKGLHDNVYCHFNYVSGTVALYGECINGHHNKGKYILTANKTDISYYKTKAECLLDKAAPLMEIYRIENKNSFDSFMLSSASIKENRRRILSSLPIHTISNELLTKILKRNKASDEDIEFIKSLVQKEREIIGNILKTNTLEDEISELSKEEFEKSPLSLFLADNFYENEIHYTYEEYLKHLELTKEYDKATANYKLTLNAKHTFRNIQILILENNWVMISKNKCPSIHFVIRHPKLRNAIQNFIPPVTE